MVTSDSPCRCMQLELLRDTTAAGGGRRIGTTTGIAKAAVFMISDETPFTNVACLVVDGGLSVLQHAVQE